MPPWSTRRRSSATATSFPTLKKGVHLISHSLGAVPRRARAYATQFLDEWENDSINAWRCTGCRRCASLGDMIAGVLGVARRAR